MLLAATGARPINDVFESITHFDFNQHFLFIDDKSDAIGNKGRLVPVPEVLSKYLNVEYKAHLRLLTDKLSQTNPEISAEILNILAGKRSEKIPFLFLLSTDDLCGWKSITQTEIRQSQLLETPLPLNLFRHRLAKFLTDKNIDAEIIDGLMGHLEYGSETNGKYSERIWLQDAKQLRVVINQAFESLDFLYVKHQPTLILKSNIHRGLNQEKISYGYLERATQRSSQLKATIKVARAEIHTFLNGRLFNQLSEDEINEISKKMVFSALGTPRQDAFLRHRILERQIERFVNKTGKDIKLKKRYLSPAPESPFNSDAANALLKIKKIRAILAQHFRIVNLTILPLRLCELYAKLLFIFENRLTAESKHDQVLVASSFRLIKIKEKYYLEILSGLNDHTSPVQRMKISSSLAFLLSKLKDSRTNHQAISLENLPDSTIDCLDAIQVVLETAHLDYEALVKAITGLMNQFNFMTMPGIVAGYLSGQIESYSLSLFDFIKLHSGKHVVLPEFETLEEPNPTLESKDEPLLLITRGEKAYDSIIAKAFLQEIRNLLNAYINVANQFASRRDFANKIDKKIELYRNKVSSSLILLGEWVKYLVEANKRHKKEVYEMSSVLRYFNALSDKFEKFAFQNNIIAMDDDELTEFYSQLLLDASKTARYFICQRLYDFHTWASKTYDLEEPDWNELPEAVKGVNVRPGFISETEYQQVLKELLNSHEDKAYARSLAIFMLLVYRFGLRSKEALGLLRGDLCQQQEKLVVLVQNNIIRKLKNKYSRRQIPLQFSLSKTEEKILEHHLAYQEANFGNPSDSPLFFDQRNSLNLSQIAYLKSKVIRILKHVTGNPMTNIHHARHSAANLIAYKIHALNLAGWKKQIHNINPDLKIDLLRLDQETTRRSSWASARYLGHAGRGTQYKNYIHFLGDWADEYHEPFEISINKISSENILDIDSLPVIYMPELKAQEIEKQVLMQPTANMLFRALIHLSNGKSVDAVSAITFISHDRINLLSEYATQISRKLRALNDTGNDGLVIMSKLTSSGFERISDLTSKVDAKVSEFGFDKYKSGHLPINELISLVGMDGQLLMFREHHFNFIRYMIDFYEIENNFFDVYKSKYAGDSFNQLLDRYHFNIKSLTSQNDTKKIQIDTVLDYETGFYVESRCALVYEKNSASLVRNRYELIILLAIYAVLNER